MIETEQEVPALYRATEIFNRMRNNGTFVGADIMGYPDVSILRPGESTTVTLNIPSDYFPQQQPPLNPEEASLLITWLLRASRYSDRSRIAQSGGVTELVTHAKQPMDLVSFENIVRSTQNGFEVDITMTNLNPVRALQLPPAGFEYIRLFIPGKIESNEAVTTIAQTLATDSADQKYIRVEGGKSDGITKSSPASIQLDIRKYARYEKKDDSIFVASLNPSNRTILDNQIGLKWDISRDDLEKIDGETQMIIGETCGIKIPEGYMGVVILGSESGFEHEHSIIIDPGFSGEIRTEHRMLPSSAFPESIQLFIYKV